MGAQNNRQASDPMEQGIKRWQYGLAGLGVVLVAAYLVYFGVWLGQMPADDSEKWGQFGDFVGGLLNPVVAFAAFYWLTQSVKLQKTELAETRKALEGAEFAQKQQAENSEKSVRIAALTAMVTAIQTQITAKDLEISSAASKAERIMRQGKQEAEAAQARENHFNTRRWSEPGLLPDDVMSSWRFQQDLVDRCTQEKMDLRQELDYYLEELKTHADESIACNRSPL